MGLLPAPRSLERTGGSLRLDGRAPPEPRVEWDGSLPEEGYALDVTPRGSRLRCSDSRGERYGRATLAGLARLHPVELPCLRAVDWPDFAERGYMLDVSRDRVPTRATLARLVDLLELLRLNRLQLYTEHTFAYRAHETVWREASPLTREDVRWLDARCHARGIELVANQNCFGHLERWLRHPEYRELAECPAGFEIPGLGRRGPGTLAPTRTGLEFALSLCRELLPNFRRREINIGCDEAWELGQGRSRGECEARGTGSVYGEFVGKLIAALTGDGNRVQFWGDVGRTHPDAIDRLPADGATALVWGYEAPADPDRVPDAIAAMMERLGWPREAVAGFGALVRPFAERDFPFQVCPGTSSWNSLLGRGPNARANLLDAGRVGRETGARGYLVTDWGDNGHLQPPSVSWLPLATGAALAWGFDANRDADVGALLDLHWFGDAERELGAALEQLGTIYLLPGVVVPNASALHQALVGGGLAGAGNVDAAAIERTLGALEDATARLERARPTCVDADLVRRELTQAARLARHGAWRLARRSEQARPSDTELRRDLEHAIAEQSACWLERSRPGGLDQSLARLERALADYA